MRGAARRTWRSDARGAGSRGITVVWQMLCGDDYQLSRLGVSGKLVGRGDGARQRWRVPRWKALVK